jgi:hypothetical protein
MSANDPLPTGVELDAFESALGDLGDPLSDICRPIYKRINAETGPEVTFDLIGRLAIFVKDLEGHADHLKAAAEQINRMIGDLDGIVRESPAGQTPWIPQFDEDGWDNFDDRNRWERYMRATAFRKAAKDSVPGFGTSSTSTALKEGDDA